MTQAQIIKFWADMPWDDIRRQANLIMPKFVFVLLVVLLAQVFAEMTWKLIAPDNTAAVGQFNHGSPGAPRFDSSSSVSLRNVSQYHLFGEANKQPAIMQKVIDAPETRLSLTLKGLFSDSDSAKAIAIISGGKGDDMTYHIGDKVAGGAELHAIYTDRVILKRNGQLETLRLPKPKLDSSSITSRNTSRNTSNHAMPGYSKPVNEPAVAEPPADETNQNTEAPNNASEGQSLSDIRDTLLKDPAKVWQDVRINPIMENGNVKGYSMTHNNAALMQSLNIRPTDIITEVNGQPLSDPTTLYGLMSTLSQQQSLSLTIERDGTQQSIELTF